MYRILIADDDAIICRGLQSTIDWAQHGIEIVGAACDGREALDMICRQKPQLLLTDIKMPVMDGIELLKEVRRSYPDMQVILLTAYEDFQYAKDAIKNKACDYLLKPLSNQELLEAVLSVKNQYESRMKEIYQRSRSLPLLKRQFLSDLLAGYYNRDRLAAAVQELGLSIDQDNYIVFDILIVDYYDKSRDLWGELLKYAVYNCVQEVSQSVSDNKVEVFQGDGDHIYVIISGLEAQQGLEACATEFAVKIRRTMSEVLDVELAFGIGGRYGGLENLETSVKEAFTALKYRHLAPEEGFSVYQKTVSGQIGKKTDLGEENRLLIQYVLLGNYDEALALLDISQKKALEGGITLGNLRMWCIGLTAHLLQETGNWSQQEGNHDYYEYCDRICSRGDIVQIFAIVEDLIKVICDGVNETQADSKTVLAHKAGAYIRSRYSDSGLSLKEVADELHVSQVYLSMLFKKAMQVTFSDFLSDIRMEAARELVVHSNLKAYEIGERVGYVNANYFSCLFKRHYQMSVSEYRKNL